MLKVLVKKQLAEVYHRSFRSGQRGKKRSGKGMAILLTILVIYLVGWFTFLAWALSDGLFEAGMSWLYYLLMGFAAILFGTFGSVFSTYATLYLAKDNDLLLSMPIPIRDVILSRLLSVYVIGLCYSGLISIPAAAVGLIRGGFRVSCLAGAIVLVLLISLIVLGLSVLLGWGVARLSLRLKNKSWVTVLFSLLFLGLYFYTYFKIMSNVQDLIENLMLLGEKIKASVYPIYLFGRMGDGVWTAMLLWIAVVLAALALIWFLLKRSFLSTATAAADGKKELPRKRQFQQRSVSAALLRKEWQRFSSSANYMLNCGLGILFILALGVFLLFRGRSLIESVTALPDAAGLPRELRTVLQEGVPVLMTAACCLLVGMIDITAPSVSLEGKNLWQLQCLPVTPWQVLRAKLELHLSLAAVPVLFCTAVLMVLAPATLFQKLLMLTVTVLDTILLALFGLFEGLRHPNLNWTNEVVPIKQSMAVLLTVLVGMFLAAAVGGLYFLLAVFGRTGATGWLSLVALVLLTIDAALVLWLRKVGSRRFAELD